LLCFKCSSQTLLDLRQVRGCCALQFLSLCVFKYHAAKCHSEQRVYWSDACFGSQLLGPCLALGAYTVTLVDLSHVRGYYFLRLAAPEALAQLCDASKVSGLLWAHLIPLMVPEALAQFRVASKASGWATMGSLMRTQGDPTPAPARTRAHTHPLTTRSTPTRSTTEHQMN
jgi:hypothetical protein